MPKNIDIPNYDPNAKPLYDVNAIRNLLPHKHPFLLVDKIMELEGDTIVGVKNITYDQYFFSGHFPEEAVFPGVLILEAMAQTGGILVLDRIENPEEMITYFLKIDKAKFKQKVVPGDTLIFKLELTGPIRRGICEMKGMAFVGQKLVAEAELVAQVTKKPEA